MLYRTRRTWQSLRLRLPVLVLLYCLGVGVVLYVVVNQTQESRFEREFVRDQLIRATELQSETERAAERGEVFTALREFAELALFEEVRAALFVAPDDRVALSSRRDWIGRPLDLAAIGLPDTDREPVATAVREARRTARTQTVFSPDRNRLVIVMPAALQINPGDSRVDRRGLILLSHDLSFGKSVNRIRLRQQFALAAAGMLAVPLGFGLILHLLVTRRIERIHTDMERFASGGTSLGEPPAGRDEISQVHRHFLAIADAVRHETAIRAAAEQALQSSQSKLVIAMDMARLAAWEFDVVTNTFTFDEHFYALLGTSAAHEGGYSMAAGVYTSRFFPPEDAPIVETEIAGLVNTTDPHYRRMFEHRFRRADGSTGIMLVHFTIEKDAVGRTLRAYGANQDVTDRTQAAAELLATTERYARHQAILATLAQLYVSSPDNLLPVIRTITSAVAQALDASPVSVWRVVDRGTALQCDDLYLAIGDAHASARRVASSECGRFFQAIMAGNMVVADSLLTDARTAGLVDTEMAPAYGGLLALPIRAGGATAGVLACARGTTATHWTLDEQTFALAVANLLSALVVQVEGHRMEQQLRQSQKLEAIGQLAGGVAHDFNNLLTVILGRAEEAMIEGQPADAEALRDISDTALRAAALTRQLLMFSRRQPMQLREVDLNAVIGNLARLLRRVLGEDVALTIVPARTPARVRADAGMIEQVLVNLAVNARDAMPRGGQLSIETTAVQLDADADRDAGRAGHWICIEVTDTGTGIAPEHLSHIFEPFFTTKDVGKGTGLGLATAYGILQQHGGWLEVTSEAGQGTQLRVFLPQHATAATAPAHADVVLAPDRGDETLMLVEDEDGVRALIARALSSRGYTVLQARNGPQALAVWSAARNSIGLVITDIVMPGGMNGTELVAALRESVPELPAVYISGYPARLNPEDLAADARDVYVAKPFSATNLAAAVRRMLDRRGPREKGHRPQASGLGDTEKRA